jgi:hypothetical protein
MVLISTVHPISNDWMSEQLQARQGAGKSPWLFEEYRVFEQIHAFALLLYLERKSIDRLINQQVISIQRQRYWND